VDLDSPAAWALGVQSALTARFTETVSLLTRAPRATFIRVQHAVKNTREHPSALGRNGSTRSPLRPCYFGDNGVDSAWRGCVSMGMPR
jgi:hypothetical protein